MAIVARRVPRRACTIRRRSGIGKQKEERESNSGMAVFRSPLDGNKRILLRSRASG